MPGIMPKFVLPTGYESEQLKAERKRKIAQALIERGLQTNPNMQSWAQVLGQLGTAFAGKMVDRKADKIDADTRTRMLSDYGTRTAVFDKLTSGDHPDLGAIVRAGQDDPFLQDRVAPYVEALKKRITEPENIVHTPTGYRRQGDVLNQPEFNPNAMMVPTGNPGEYGVNAARVTAALAAQPNTTITGAQTTIRDPSMSAPPPPQRLPTGEAPQPLSPNTMDIGALSPEERSILQHELQRRAGGGNYQLQNDTHIPMGSPITAIKPPAGVAKNGKPYWIINGVPYDNPEGR